MYYVLMNDLHQIIKSKYKYLIIYLFFICIFLVYEMFLKLDIRDILFSILGLEVVKKNILFLILYIANIMIALFISYQLFTNDYKNSKDNIFLRVLPNKWFIFKSISCFIINFLFRLIIFLITGVILFLFNKEIDMNFCIILFFKSSFYFYFIQILFLLTVYIYQTKPFLLFPLILLILLFNKVIIQCCLGQWWLYIIFGILINIIIIKIYNNIFTVLFEKNGG